MAKTSYRSWEAMDEINAARKVYRDTARKVGYIRRRVQKRRVGLGDLANKKHDARTLLGRAKTLESLAHHARDMAWAVMVLRRRRVRPGDKIVRKPEPEIPASPASTAEDKALEVKGPEVPPPIQEAKPETAGDGVQAQARGSAFMLEPGIGDRDPREGDEDPFGGP